MKTLVCFCLMILATAAMLVADVNIDGKWSGSFVMTADGGESHDSTVFMVLKQEGSNITGTLGPSEEQQWTIQKGKLDGNKISLEVQSDGPLVIFDLVLSGDHIKGDAHASSDGHSLTAKLDATRAK